MKQKTGILGGTFDPVHNGHLVLADEARRECGLDSILFIPAAVPPHKKAAEVTSFEHRVSMLQIACSLFPSFRCSSIEGGLPEPSYTIDTLKVLLSRMGEKNKYFFIIGCDAFLEIPTWKSYRNVVQLVSFIVSKRKGSDENKLADLAVHLGYTVKDSFTWIGPSGNREIRFLRTVPPDISSTTIRKKIRDNQITAGTIPEKVIEYIKANNLYGAVL
ncbi:MAG: nicotinate (nicotinamide) nucleotide adenylyltransferase [Deltaproteobacteria bacterium]|nr:nicotinate (nicotinamide) nucleotide adenylyltransferase [Deltaproteobacteria bacterium]